MVTVVGIIGILAAIAYPNYQRYVMETKRTDMMSEMQNIAIQIESRKLAQGSYNANILTGLGGDYPKQGAALYTVTFTPQPITRAWTIIATPKVDQQMANDGNLTLNFQGIRCRNNVCGVGDEWR